MKPHAVTPVTKREINAKKNLILVETSLHLSYHLDPVQGPAGSRFREILPLPMPEARFLIFGANLVFTLHQAALMIDERGLFFL